MMGEIKKVLFLDESGDHSLDVIDPQYPMFVLGGVLMDMSYAQNELEQKVRAFKRELFRLGHLSGALIGNSEKTVKETIRDMDWWFCPDKKRARTRYAVPS